MKNSTQCFTALLAFCCLFVSPLYAAKVAQVEICHYDFDKSEYKLILMSTKGSDNHKLNHPDDHPGAAVPGNDGSIFDESCNVIEDAAALLAIAYIDVDRNGSYAADIDIPMVEVRDDNRNGIFDIGDVVIFGQYPITLDPCPLSESECDVYNFPLNVGSHEVTLAGPGAGGVGYAFTAGGCGFRIFKDGFSESLVATCGDGVYGIQYEFTDHFLAGLFDDYININSESENVYEFSGPVGADNYFFNLTFY